MLDKHTNSSCAQRCRHHEFQLQLSHPDEKTVVASETVAQISCRVANKRICLNAAFFSVHSRIFRYHQVLEVQRNPPSLHPLVCVALQKVPFENLVLCQKYHNLCFIYSVFVLIMVSQFAVHKQSHVTFVDSSILGYCPVLPASHIPLLKS